MIRGVNETIAKTALILYEQTYYMEGTMGEFKEYHQYDGLGLAELIRKKEVSAQEVCE